MKSEWKTFIVVVVAVIVIAGSAIAIGRRGNDKTDIKTAENSDEGEIAGTSTESANAGYQESLAKDLTAKGAVLYGAYWCPHCKEQKQLFGDAVKYLNYVECDAAGENANPEACQANEIKSYPTWIYQGKKYNGTRTLAELAAMVGFEDGSANSSNESPAEGSGNQAETNTDQSN